MSKKRKAFIWSGVVRSDFKVTVGPAFDKPGELINLSIQSTKTHRSDIDGVRFSIYCDNEFDVKISNKGKLLMIIQGEEVYKYWCSTVEEAVERAKELLNEDDPVYCICKKAENYYVFHSKKMKLSAHEIIETVTRQPESAEVNHEVIN